MKSEIIETPIMKIGVYTLQKVVYQGDARLVNVKTVAGEVTILDHHRPFISILSPGVMRIISGDGETEYIPVSSGFVEVRSGTEARFLIEEGRLAR